MMKFETLEKIKIEGMPFIPDEDVYIKFDSPQEARDTVLWMIANGVNYVGYNVDRIYISRDDFKKIAKKLGYHPEMMKDEV